VPEQENRWEIFLVGGFSVILHGYSRTTGDIDIWVDRSLDNYQKHQFSILDGNIIHFGEDINEL
jgi:hypothetical protein